MLSRWEANFIRIWFYCQWRHISEELCYAPSSGARSVTRQKTGCYALRWLRYGHVGYCTLRALLLLVMLSRMSRNATDDARRHERFAYHTSRRHRWRTPGSEHDISDVTAHVITTLRHRWLIRRAQYLRHGVGYHGLLFTTSGHWMT